MMASVASVTTSGVKRQRPEDDLWRSAYQRMKNDPDGKKSLARLRQVMLEQLSDNGQSPGHLGSTEGRQHLLKLIDKKSQAISNTHGTSNKVMQAVLKTKDVVSAGAAASPPASIAVAGLFIAVSIGQNFLEQKGAVIDCTELVAKIIQRRAVEDGQTRIQNTNEATTLQELRRQLQSSYLDLYLKILSTIAKLVYMLDSKFRLITDNLFSLTDWVAEKRVLDDAERECERNLETIDRYINDPSHQPSAYEKEGWNNLHWNALTGESSLVAESIQKHEFDINAKTPCGLTALSLAAEEGNLQCCKNILPVKGLDKNSQNRSGHTALHLAARKDRKEVVDLLVSKGLNVNIRDKDGRTALHLAAQSGRVNAVKSLRTAKGIDLNAQDDEGRTALHLAAMKRKATVVKVLAEKGAIVEAKDGRKRTAFLDAAAAGNTEIVKILLDHGADVNQVTANHQWTPLHICASAGHLKCLKTLLEASGIRIDAQTKRGRTPLHEAVLSSKAPKSKAPIVKTLCGKGASIDTRSSNQRTAFLDAAKEGDLDVVKILRDCGAELNQVTGKNQWSALHEAANTNNLELVQYLVKQGIEKDLKVKGGTKKGMTAKEIAQACGYVGVAEAL